MVPQIRFAGFTDPWEQRKLGEVAYGFEYGLNAAASDFDGEKKYLRITDIDDRTREFRTDDLSSPDINNPIDDKYLLKEGDILFARTGASVGKTYLYRASDGKTYYAGFLIRAHVSDEADAGFIFQSTLTERYKQFVLLTSQRSGQPGINAQEYADLLLPLPSLSEQRRIGKFFSRLDSLITLHQRKYDKLCVLKKSMLDKMFPKGGSLYPEIRFAGFTDPWEQRKLGELTESYSGGTPAAGESEFYGGSIPFIRSAEIAAESTELFLTEKGYESSSARMVKPGDVLYALYGATSGEVAVSRQKGAINQAILAILPRDDCDARYITAWLRKQKGYIVTTYLQGGQGNLSGVIVKNLEVSIPSLPEQQKIGFMLSHLDSLITLHQRKLELLRNIKKSMLDKMFV
ncbi:restriction-modification system specificity subunit [Bifidobacterium catenulatum DSM 16992 = JCM 1194 = LMG 11043]|uniref:Restriction-modification system specificity subunit n=1 Tax=Bifidobacterium catenulatum DSM 16992 = JCM 1194 = LMG 11043 TaxID=566552 RepID=A0ABN5V0S3_9BIFI|nr:restriction-modification system specificity subunit [Bifidobacterium catenulatum DSM 16992 = JCM 1194 = LMG 11043]